MVIWIFTATAMAHADVVANRVLGQFDFVHNGANVITNTGLWNPRSVAVDSSIVPNRLYVADAGNHRVLGWRKITALTSGSPADVVIGQADFLSWVSQCNNAAVTGETLCVPAGIAVDGSGNLYVVDQGNNRVLEYNTPFTADTVPDRVFGQLGSFTSSDCNQGGVITALTLCNPNDVAVDGKGNVYIADTGNSRVLEYDSPLSTDQRADRVFGQAGRFTSGICDLGGVSAHSLCRPAAVAADAGGNLYVADNGNFRALEYDTPVAADNTTADLVFGQGNSFGSKANSCVAGASAGALCTPGGLGIDGAGNLYISDSSFSRIQAYNNPLGSKDTTPDAVFGQPDFSTALCNETTLGPGRLCLPFGLALDAAGDLFAADFGNARMLEYEQPLATHPPNTDAGLVLGQSALNLNGVNGAKPGGLFRPAAVAVDLSASPNRLYVADTDNSRVLGWKSVPSFANGAPADLVIGQAGLLSAGCNRNRSDAAGNPMAAADTLCSPGGVGVDAGGNLYVADSNNFRVLEYNTPFSSGTTAGLTANLVLGQNGSFTTRVNNNGGVSALSMSAPEGVAIDKLGHLYVADPFNNRVLEYNHPTTANTAADAVFGQGGSFVGSDCNFNTGCGRVGCAAAANSLCGPSAVAVDGAGDAYIADTFNNRVLEYFSPLTDQIANVVIGQHNFKGISCTTLCQPQGVAIDAGENLYAADTLNAQVKKYQAPLTNGASPSLVIGSRQCDQAVAKAGTLCGVAGLGFDSGGNLYAADTFDNRVLEFNQPFIVPTPTPTPMPTRTPTPTAIPTPSPPLITSIPAVILVGASFQIAGSHFTQGSVVNFFVATATGPINAGPLPLAAGSPTELTVNVPLATTLGQGFAEVQVVNTDRGFAASNLAPALLQGSAAAGIPSLTSINGGGLAANSSDPNFATNNVDTVVVPGGAVKLGGTGFDTAHGVAVDLFCACPKGKVGPFFINPGNPGLHSTSAQFTLPASGPDAPATGPGSFMDTKFGRKSNAVAAPIGHRISVTSVSQSGTTLTVNGTGFSILTVINLFNTHGAMVVNLGGLKSGGTPVIPLTFVSQSKFSLTLPAGAVPGPTYIQALNPPFVPFSSSGDAPGGSIVVH